LLQIHRFSLHDENVSNTEVGKNGEHRGKYGRSNGEGQRETKSQTAPAH
jgi:hypothetical protein